MIEREKAAGAYGKTGARFALALLGGTMLAGVPAPLLAKEEEAPEEAAEQPTPTPAQPAPAATAPQAAPVQRNGGEGRGQRGSYGGGRGRPSS